MKVTKQLVMSRIADLEKCLGLPQGSISLDHATHYGYSLDFTRSYQKELGVSDNFFMPTSLKLSELELMINFALRIVAIDRDFNMSKSVWWPRDKNN